MLSSDERQQRLDLGDAELNPKLGEGAGGSVFLATYNGRRVAVKQVKKGQEDEALVEARITKSLHTPKQHPHVLVMFGVTLRGGRTCTVTENMKLKGLDEWAWDPSPLRGHIRVRDVARLELQAVKSLGGAAEGQRAIAARGRAEL